MSLRKAHPLTMFHLVPISLKAEAMLDNSRNLLYVSLNETTQKPGLEIGFHIRAKKGPSVIAEIGRNADLIAEGRLISNVQFGFEVHPESKEIMLHDRSTYHRTKVEPFGFRTDGPFHQIVLQRNIEYLISSGGENKDMYVFQLHWNRSWNEQQPLLRGIEFAAQTIPNSHLVLTDDDGPTDLPSLYRTRFRTSTNVAVQRVINFDHLGGGGFGAVYRAVDMDTGSFVAVKTTKFPVSLANASVLTDTLKEELKTLSDLSHKNIIEYLGSSGWDSDTIHVYLPLKDGAISSLFATKPALRSSGVVVQSLWQQMLQALDYLAYRNIIHRDVKPDNILYIENKNAEHEYLFQLADFGLAKQSNLARTHCGTLLFMAPEMLIISSQQTTKIDIWSLFATLINVTASSGFNEDFRGSYGDGLQLLKEAAKTFPPLEPMGREDPNKRFSAAQMLVLRFNGRGLSTPRSRIRLPDIDSGSAATPTAATATQMSSKNAAPASVKASEMAAPQTAHMPVHGGIKKQVQQYQRRNIPRHTAKGAQLSNFGFGSSGGLFSSFT